MPLNELPRHNHPAFAEGVPGCPACALDTRGDDLAMEALYAKPLHVRVAEALGCETRDRGDGVILCGCDAHPHGGEPDEHGDRYPVLSYDTSWSATGPLIERYGISVQWHQSWTVPARFDSGTGTKVCDETAYPAAWEAVDGTDEDGYEEVMGSTPLIAVCNLLLALHAAGKLKEAE